MDHHRGALVGTEAYLPHGLAQALAGVARRDGGGPSKIHPRDRPVRLDTETEREPSGHRVVARREHEAAADAAERFVHAALDLRARELLLAALGHVEHPGIVRAEIVAGGRDAGRHGATFRARAPPTAPAASPGRIVILRLLDPRVGGRAHRELGLVALEDALEEEPHPDSPKHGRRQKAGEESRHAGVYITARLLDRPRTLNYRPRALKSVLLAIALLGFLLPASALAQAMDEELPPGMAGGEDRDYLLATEPEAPSAPSRILITAGVGSSVRLIQDLDFSQGRSAPLYIDLFGAFVLPGPMEGLRHGIGLGASLNLTGDGPAPPDSLGLDGATQIALGPYYMAYLRLGWDFLIGGKLGVPVSLSPGLAPGLELAVSLTWYLTAGLGLYAEVSGSAWLGQASTIHPIVSGEAGVAIDYEVLP